MRFTLTFEGRLPSASKESRLPEKHKLRLSVHKQLRELYRRNESLPKLPDGRDWAGWTEWKWPRNWKGSGRDNLGWGEEDTVVSLGNLKFVPLVRRSLAIYCELDVLFLRYGEPGSLISGDIDKRILTLSDGLRLPKGDAEVAHVCAQNDFAINDPVFCLLEDDSLVTRWNVRTDRLLAPIAEGNSADVKLIIDVHIKATKMWYGNVDLIGD
ncbi:MAG: hypothetical protein WA206_20105 [Candidatus Binatus sp.]